MPTLNIDMFDEAPKVGDKIRVTGKIKSINEDSGEVEASYDDVKILKKDHKDNTDNTDNPDMQNMPPETAPNSQSLDQALADAFPNTQ